MCISTRRALRGLDTVAVAGDVLRFRKALIATGARPLAPSVPGLAESGYWTDETIFNLTECPGRLLVMGGGPLGLRIGASILPVRIARYHCARRPHVSAEGRTRRGAGSFGCLGARRSRLRPRNSAFLTAICAEASATVVARHAAEMINGLTVAISSGVGLRAFARVMHSYPTQADAIKLAAEAYARARLTPTLKFLSRCWLAW